jgi:hypothetical protein
MKRIILLATLALVAMVWALRGKPLRAQTSSQPREKTNRVLSSSEPSQTNPLGDRSKDRRRGMDHPVRPVFMAWPAGTASEIDRRKLGSDTKTFDDLSFVPTFAIVQLLGFTPKPPGAPPGDLAPNAIPTTLVYRGPQEGANSPPIEMDVPQLGEVAPPCKMTLWLKGKTLRYKHNCQVGNRYAVMKILFVP